MRGALIPFVILTPLLGATFAWRVRRPSDRGALLVGIAILHAAGVSLIWWLGDAASFGGWLAADALALLVLAVLSALFLVVSISAAAAAREDTPRGGRAFVSCMLAFLGAASLVAVSQQFALLWVGMESTTLAIAPLIYDRKDRRSLEAVWKYLMLSSVGIAFALLAVFLLASAQPVSDGARPLMLPDLIAAGGSLDTDWLRFAVVFALIGFGTKMGLAPLHSWKPDTYGEAPSTVGALMAGGMTTCAFVGVVRFMQVAEAASLGPFIRPLLIAFGLISMFVATAFILGQADIKRLLAYSSVEHMGLLVLGLGVGGVGAGGAMLHLVNNALTKGFLFLAVGNLVAAGGTSAASDLRGMLRVRPVSAVLMLAGLFAVTGAPPFGMFLSEFTIISGALHQDHPWVATAAVLLLVVIFVGIASMMIEIAFGAPPEGAVPPVAVRERASAVGGPLLLAGIVLILGSYVPGPVLDALARVAESVGGKAP